MTMDAERCARAILDGVPPAMAAIRAEMRRRRGPELTVPQFRALLFLRRHPGASLSEVGRHVGLALPSVSRIVDRLVARRLARRAADRADRRRVSLVLTPRGTAVLRTARAAAQRSLAARLAAFSPAERRAIARAMPLLRALAPAEARRGAGGGRA